jgi:uncharacterized protein YqjF (DUF2071 family)
MTGPASRTLLQARRHRPFPVPRTPWLGRQWWGNVLFAHWPVRPAELDHLLPDGLQLELFGGRAWVGLVAFQIRLWPRAMPWAGRSFTEVNLRTYVTDGSRSGVWFFSLDASSRFAVRAARLLLNLPYNEAAAEVRVDDVGAVECSSARRVDGAAVAGRFHAAGPARGAVVGSLEEFLTERYCLYGVHRAFGLYRLDIHHRPWLLQPACGVFQVNTLLGRLPLTVMDPPVLHLAADQHVLTWGPVPLGVRQNSPMLVADHPEVPSHARALRMAEL